ncbi:MAG: DsbA family oxidoreductase [Oscillospiraceae bacterium]|nr:DsbA family oxidoreductase [Oscillospiraceae bacterium]
MKITYWSDYACPYCYIGEMRLKRAIAEIPELKDVEVEMKAFQLDPNAGAHAEGDTQTRFANKYGISMEAAGRQIESISEMGRAEGIDFRYATTLFTNTMDAHRLTKLAQSKKDPVLTERVIEALFDAYFTKNRELADRGLLQEIGENCGLDAGEVRDMLSSDQYRDEVLTDEKAAAYHGIHAVPFFVINERYSISGAPDREGLRSALLKLMEKEAEEAMATGMSCGPEGCRIR